MLHCDTSRAFAEAATGTPVAPSITSCLFPYQARVNLNVLGQVALIMFMFLVGIEVNYSRLKGRAKAIGSVTVAVVALPIALGFLIGPVLYNAKFVGFFGTDTQPSRVAFALMVGAMLSVTAFPVMAHILQEKALSTSRMGSVGIASAATVSVLMFLAITLAASVASHDSGGDIATRFIAAAAYVAVMALVVRPLLRPLGRAAEEKATVTPPMFGVIFVLVFASAFVADRIGINVIPGAFLAGAVLPARELINREMRLKLRDITLVVLLPIFLAYSGLNTDFSKLGISFAAGIALFLAAGIAGKWVGGLVGGRVGGLTWQESNVVGVLMNCRGLLVLVAALIALQSGVISPQMQAGAVLMALITTMMTGPLFDRAVSKLPADDHAAAEGAVPAPAPPSGAPTPAR